MCSLPNKSYSFDFPLHRHNSHQLKSTHYYRRVIYGMEFDVVVYFIFQKDIVNYFYNDIKGIEKASA